MNEPRDTDAVVSEPAAGQEDGTYVIQNERLAGPGSVLEDLGFTFLARTGVILFSIANQSMLAWCLGPGDRGSYALGIVFANILAVVFALGIDQAGQYYIASGKLSRRDSTVTTLGVGVMLSVLAVVTGILSMQAGLEFFSKAPPFVFTLSLGLVPLLILNVCVGMLLLGLREFKGIAVVTIVQALFQVASVLVLILILRRGLEGALWASIVSNVVQLAMGLRLLHRHGALALRLPAFEHTRAILSYGLRFFVGSVTVAMNVQVGTVLMAMFADRQEIGIFSVAVDFITRIILLPDIVIQVILPRVSSDRRGSPELVATAARLVSLICIGVLLLILLSSWLVVPLLFSPEFVPMIPLLWILGLGVAARCATKLFIPYLSGTNRPEIFSLASLAGIIINLAWIWLLFPSTRLTGAAWALTASYLVSSVILALAFRKLSGLRFGATWIPTGRDLVPVMRGLRRIRARAASVSRLAGRG